MATNKNEETNEGLSKEQGLTAIAPEIDLTDKVALVTGGTVGIGREIVESYLRFGANKVIVTDIREDGLKALKQEFGDKVETVAFDFNRSSPQEWKQFNEELRRKIGDRLDIMVLNAGVVKMYPMADANSIDNTPIDEFESLYRINTLANVKLYQGLNDLLQQSDSPRVIATTSPIVGRDDPKTAAYAMTKGANEAILQNIAAELKAEMGGKENVIVTAIDPGRVQTFLRSDIYKGEPYGAQPQPEDIVEPWLRLASPQADTAWHNHVLIIQNTVAGELETDGKKFKQSRRTENGYEVAIAKRPLNQAGAIAEIIATKVDTYSSRELMEKPPAPATKVNINLASMFVAPPEVLPETQGRQKPFLVLHDRDDNLVKEKITFQAYQKILADKDIVSNANDLARQWSGKRYEFALKHFENTYNITLGDPTEQDESRRFQKIYEDTVLQLQSESLELLPHVRGTLKILAQVGIDQAMVTNNSKKVTSSGNKLAGLQEIFPENQIHSGDWVKKIYPETSLQELTARNQGYKPSPDLYIHAMQQNRVDPQYVVAIEDSLSGVAAAKAAGIQTIVGNVSALKETGADDVTIARRIQELQSQGANHIITDYAQLLQIVKEVAPSEIQNNLEELIGSINSGIRGNSGANPDLKAVIITEKTLRQDQMKGFLQKK